MKYTHWAAGPVTLDKTRTYEQNADNVKPKGLWLSVDGDWERWCEDEGYREKGKGVEHVVEVDLARVLHLSDARAIDIFTRRYFEEEQHRYLTNHIFINWNAVARDYAGLVIAPYCWERRLADHTFWYYGWDCASACIWDLSVITKFEVTNGLPILQQGD